jgi:hypothetical protein
MHAMASTFHDFYNALTEAGIRPAAARRVEHQLEQALAHAQETARKDTMDRLMTKEDGLKLSATLHETLHNMVWKMIGLILAAHSALFAAMRYIN